MDSICTPKAEAKDRTLEAMNALRENRWNRKRNLLPNLSLTYPTEDESRHIAELATVNDASFSQHIESIILDAHLNDASLRTLSIPQVRTALKHVANRAAQLGRLLGKLDVGRESRGSENHAGWLIEQELALRQTSTGEMVLIPKYIDLPDALSSAARRSAQLLDEQSSAARRSRKKPIPRGAGGNPAFDLFIQSLVMAVRMRGGTGQITG
jgi:hypothetical protein